VTIVTPARVSFVSIPMMPLSESQLPAWPETSPEDDPMLAARGIVYSVVLSLPFWFVVVVLTWWMSS
jgi:hypothetical protein